MIYLDHHATTPVDARVLEAMLPFFTEKFGNAASKQHRFGWDANDAVERARKQVAALIGAGSKDIVFTSGATEANNLAIKGAARAAEARRKRDHLRDDRDRAQGGARPDGAAGEGRLARHGGAGAARRRWSMSRRVADAITERTALVSVMAANNEIGVLQPIKEAGGRGAREGRVVSHRRGAGGRQGAVRCGRARRGLRVDHGPQGLRAEGRRRAVCARRPSFARATEGRLVTIAAEIDGGGHERGMRSGTLNVPGIVGFGRAAEIARAGNGEPKSTRVAALRDRLLERLQSDDGRDDGERRDGRAAARQPERELRRHRRGSAAGEPRRHRGVVGRGVHAGGTVARA